MTDFVTASYAETELVIKKSRFLAFVYPLDTEEDAERYLAELRKKYYDATHVCFAYIADEMGNRARFSDDGEPSGTAGMPMCDALKKSGVRKVLVAVVRYFGGVLLGAGGLVRAYSSATSEVLALAQKIRNTYCDLYEVSFDFSLYKKISAHLPKLGKIRSVEYGAAVTVSLAVPFATDPKSELEKLCARPISPIKTGSGYVGEKI